ncbi:hypothetical protein D3C77_442330 [compost metagenome]
MAAFDANFIANAFHWVERLVAFIAHPRGLRVEDFGVAGIQRPGLVEVIHHPGIWDEYPGFLTIDLGGRGAVRAVFGVAFPVDHPAAEDQVEGVSQVQTRGEVGGVLGLFH